LLAIITSPVIVQIMKKPLSIYIHWPWCKSKCPYCDFNSHVAQNAPHDAYIDAILTDINHQKTLTGDRYVTSIFFGGGTPSLMEPQYIERILAHVNNVYGINKDTEITMEANPTSSSADKFKGFRHAGINRLSIGVQSFNPDDLKFLGREHSEIDARYTVENALNIFDNVSFDMIFGLPHQQLDSWLSQLKYAIDIGTQHLSAYQLTIEKNTVFYAQVKKNKWRPMNDDIQADFYEATRELLTAHNYNHYEISNFAKDGYNCQHNYNIWQYGDYIGVGAGAHGRVKNTKNQCIATQNYKMPDKYIEAVEHVKHGFYKETKVLAEEQRQEMILMGLRVDKGIPLSLLSDKTATCQPLQGLISNGLLQINGDNIVVTDKGQLLLDSILQELIID
jgi:putative oxygen-independent coproporphyrinogen III oxidase